jgi:serine kinase of HPr protein (carbohydrate metabolism regulator)
MTRRWMATGPPETSRRLEHHVQSVSVARLFEDQRDELQLEQLTVSLASKREITLSDVNRPGMALMGFLDNFLPERIQILAQTEV